MQAPLIQPPSQAVVHREEDHYGSVEQASLTCFNAFLQTCHCGPGASLQPILANTVHDLPPLSVTRQHILNTKTERKHSGPPCSGSSMADGGGREQ